MFKELKKINERPEPFECITTDVLWNDPHISKHMLETHLNEDVNLASRKMAFIEKSVAWIVSRFSVGSRNTDLRFRLRAGVVHHSIWQRRAQR